MKPLANYCYAPFTLNGLLMKMHNMFYKLQQWNNDLTWCWWRVMITNNFCFCFCKVSVNQSRGCHMDLKWKLATYNATLDWALNSCSRLYEHRCPFSIFCSFSVERPSSVFIIQLSCFCMWLCSHLISFNSFIYEKNCSDTVCHKQQNHFYLNKSRMDPTVCGIQKLQIDLLLDTIDSFFFLDFKSHVFFPPFGPMKTSRRERSRNRKKNIPLNQSFLVFMFSHLNVLLLLLVGMSTIRWKLQSKTELC